MTIDKDLLFCLLLLLLIVLIYPSLCQVESFVLDDNGPWGGFDNIRDTYNRQRLCRSQGQTGCKKYKNLIEEENKIKKKVSKLTPEEKTMVDKERKQLELLFNNSERSIEINKLIAEIEGGARTIGVEEVTIPTDEAEKIVEMVSMVYTYYQKSYVNEKLDSFIDKLISKRENKELEGGLFDALW